MVPFPFSTLIHRVATQLQFKKNIKRFFSPALDSTGKTLYTEMLLSFVWPQKTF